MIDVHVHLAALPEPGNGCWISPKMLNSTLFRFVMHRMGIDPGDPAKANQVYLDRLLKTLKESQFVNKAVILALDGVYNADGSLNKEETEFLISNDHVLSTAKAHSEQLLPGVSINPMRRDAGEELQRCAAAVAVLVKVLPNTQRFNPAEPALAPFWRRMAALKLPLLTHVGYEWSLIGRDQSVGDLVGWQNALEAGVTVIAAHGASHGVVFWERHWKTLGEFVRRYPHFYWDASALSLWNRCGMLLRIRRRPEIIKRMVFGTDYPLPCFAFPALLAGKIRHYWELRGIKNPFDRHYRLLEVLGVVPSPAALASLGLALSRLRRERVEPDETEGGGEGT